MSNLPVHWHEGMFLRPHHFQATDRYWADHTAQTGKWNQNYNWGVWQLDIDTGALKTGRLVVPRLQARMRDGTLVRVGSGGNSNLADREVRQQVNAAAGDAGTVDVFLAVPTLDVGRANVGGGGDDVVRYKVETPPGGVPDENVGQNSRPLAFRRLNPTLLLSGEDPAGYDTLQIARLARSTTGDGAPQLSEAYIPPVLRCEAWTPLREQVLQHVYHKIGSLVRDLGSTVRDRGITFADPDPDAFLMFEQVRALNEIAAPARMAARTDGQHPLAAYAELCRIIGRLAIFDTNVRTIPDVPDYDHDDLGGVFFELKRLLDHLLNMIGADRKFQSRPFTGHGLQMRVEMDEPWLSPGWTMYVGVDANMKPGDVVRLLTDGALNMKIASSDRVDEVFARGHLGMRFVHEPQPPRFLPTPNISSYFLIQPNKDEWPFVQKTRKVAIRLNERLLVGDLEGKREVTFRGPSGREPVMRFTLYIIPPKG